MGQGALEGLRVVDFSRVLAGPWATQILADLGADVIKVERPEQGDETRQWGPPFVGGESAYFLAANRGKRSLTLNLKAPEGQELARRLVQRADVLVENFKPGDLARYGLDWESVRELNPRLIYCSITGFGSHGPRAHEAGYDFAIQAMSGIMAVTGEPEGEPMKVGVAWVDILTGLYAAVGILAALQERQRSGRGQRIDLSLFDVAVAAMANVGQAWLVTGKSPARLGNAHPQIVPYQLFQAADGYVVVAVGNDQQFRRLCQALGGEAAALADDPRFATNQERVRNRAALVQRLQALIATRPVTYWVQTLHAHGVPVAPVRHVGEALADPQASARRLLWQVIHPTAGPLRLLASPLQHMDGTPAVPRGAPPRLGEHTDTILAELGLEPDAIRRLREAGVV